RGGFSFHRGSGWSLSTANGGAVVADVIDASRVGLARQIQLVAGLRWQILRNHLRRKSSLLDFIGILAIVACGAVLIVGVAIAFYFGGHQAVSTGQLGWLTPLFLGILLFWQIFPLFAAGFGVNFEFRTLLRFPLSLGAFYLIALAYGLADFAAIASVCWLRPAILGIGAASPGFLPARALIGVLLLLMSVTVERLLGSWFERLLARRVTRELFFGFIIILSVSGQFVKPLMDRFHGHPPQAIVRVMPYLSLTPPALA